MGSENNQPKENMSNAKTESITLESNMKIQGTRDGWTITVGGVQQPEWTAKSESLEGAIAELVRMTTEDAINDEALAWKEGGNEPNNQRPRQPYKQSQGGNQVSETPLTDEFHSLQRTSSESKGFARALEKGLTASNAALEAAKAERDKFEQWAKESKENAAYAVMLRNQELEACQKELAEAKEKKPCKSRKLTQPEIDDLKHNDGCRWWDDAEFCSCGAVEAEQLERAESTLTELLEVAERIAVELERQATGKGNFVIAVELCDEFTRIKQQLEERK